MRNTGVAALFAAICAQSGMGQTPCTVREERTVWTQSARFSVGMTTARVTLFTYAYRSDPPVAFPEVTGEPADLWIEAGGERVLLRSGAHVQVMPIAGERVKVRLTTPAGETLCSWIPYFRGGWMAGEPGLRAEAFGDWDAWEFHNAGEPISLAVGGSVAGPQSEFTLDGTPAVILARNSHRVILRDPKPSAGTRTVASEGHTARLRFIEVQTTLSRRPSKGGAVLTVRVSHLEFWYQDQPARLGVMSAIVKLPTMLLVNDDRDNLELRCGFASVRPLIMLREDVDLSEYRTFGIRSSKVHDGVFTVECPVQFRKEGPVRLNVEVVEAPPLLGALLH